MTNPNNGGAAFPAIQSNGKTILGGMTLRDYFAGQALAGLATLEADCGPHGVAYDAYRLADAMLRAREE